LLHISQGDAACGFTADAKPTEFFRKTFGLHHLDDAGKLLFSVGGEARVGFPGLVEEYFEFEQ